MLNDIPGAENRKVNAFKQCYLQHCIEQNAFPHQAIMKRIRMAEEGNKRDMCR